MPGQAKRTLKKTFYTTSLLSFVSSLPFSLPNRLTLLPAVRVSLSYVNSLEQDETPSISAPHWDQSCL